MLQMPSTTRSLGRSLQYKDFIEFEFKYWVISIYHKDEPWSHAVGMLFFQSAGGRQHKAWGREPQESGVTKSDRSLRSGAAAA
jgi:hypothetical protein